MSIYWRRCEDCFGSGEIEIATRFDRLFKLRPKIEQCSNCKGRGSIPSNTSSFNSSWGKKLDE